MKDMEAKVEKIEIELQKAENSKASLEKELEASVTELQLKQATAKESENKFKGMEAKVEKIEIELQKAENSKASLEKELEASVTELQLQQATVNRLVKEVRWQTGELTRQKHENAEMKVVLEKLNDRIQTLDADRRGKEVEVEKLKKSVQELAEEVMELQRERGENRRIKDAFGATEAKNIIQDAIEKLKKRAKGFAGELQDDFTKLCRKIEGTYLRVT